LGKKAQLCGNILSIYRYGKLRATSPSSKHNNH